MPLLCSEELCFLTVLVFQLPRLHSPRLGVTFFFYPKVHLKTNYSCIELLYRRTKITVQTTFALSCIIFTTTFKTGCISKILSSASSYAQMARELLAKQLGFFLFHFLILDLIIIFKSFEFLLHKITFVVLHRHIFTESLKYSCIMFLAIMLLEFL